MVKISQCIECKELKEVSKKDLCKQCYSKEYMKEYNQRPKVKEYREKYYQKSENKKKHSEYCSKYQKDNYHTPEGTIRRIRGMIKRNERMNKVEHNFSFYEWWGMVLETKGICPGCKVDVGLYNLTMDHIVPVSKVPEGFVYTIKDIRPLCKPCNSSKSDSYDKELPDNVIDDFVEGKYLGEVLAMMEDK